MRERLAGSTLLSLLLHVAIAILLFSVALNSSQEGASEDVSGAEVISLDRHPVVASVPAPVQQAAPVPHVTRIAPVLHHAPLVRAAARPVPPQRHELTAFAPTAPPNPTPVPQASAQPNPQPTTPVFEPKPENDIAAVPKPVPTVNVDSVTVKLPPTAAPSPVPPVRASASPAPKPPAATAAPTAEPETPAPVQATASPTAAPSPKGVPSPSPTQAPAVAKVTAGTAPSPGPKGESSPGPKPGNAGMARPGPARPVSVRETPSPRPARTAAPPAPTPGSGLDINAKLRALLPHTDVNPAQLSQRQTVSVAGRLEPTPPPAVIAQTKFLFDERDGGGDRVKMWVTGTHREGPLLICEGWMVRYPPNVTPGHNATVFGGVPAGTLAPIVEDHASTPCSQRSLEPFAPSAAASP